MNAYQRFASLAECQFGVASTTQARATGITDDQAMYLVRHGKLRRPARNVLAVAGSPPTWHQSVMVAVLSAGSPGAYASHATAAYLWHMTDSRRNRIEIVMHRWDRSVQKVTVHESKDLLDEDTTTIGPIPATTPARTVVDLGASARHLVPRALDAGLRKGLFSLHDVAALVGRVRKKGRRGVGVIRPLIEERLMWNGIAESELEDLFRRVCQRFDLPQAHAQVEIRRPDGSFICRTDFAYPQHHLRIELDSEAYHMDRTTFRRDRAVQNVTELLGWTTLRYTWWDLITRPESVADEVQLALLTSAPSPAHVLA
jgi:very-short-patch-repair endonuclease